MQAAYVDTTKNPGLFYKGEQDVNNFHKNPAKALRTFDPPVLYIFCATQITINNSGLTIVYRVFLVSIKQSFGNP